MRLIYLLLILIPGLAKAQDLSIQDLQAQPCSVNEKPLVDSEGERVSRELKMFRLIDESHNFRSQAPNCLSQTECKKLIAKVQASLVENQQVIYKYEGPVLNQALAEIKAGQNLSATTLEFIQRSSHYFQDHSLDAWLEAGAPNPAAHVAELQAASTNLSQYAANKWNLSSYKQDAASETANIQIMQAQLLDYQTKIYPSEAAALEVEEAKWTGYLNSQKALQACHLSVAERAAFWWYTSMGYSLVNPALRSPQASVWQPFVDVMNHAFSKVRRVDGSVYRGTTLPSDLLKQYVVSASVVYLAYTSTSASSVDHFSGDQQFEIHTFSGRWIAPFSANPKELEVLIPAGARFTIKQTDGSPITMDEVRP